MAIARRSLLGAGALMLGGWRTALAGEVRVEDIFPLTETTNGKIRGIRAGGVNIFKGIPYGEDTSGRNRYMPPRRARKWSGVRDASNYGNYAPHGPSSRDRAYTGLIHFDIQPGGMGEDCLVANVWTPTLDRNARRPVMLYLHGGGYYGGSSNSPGYDGEELARFGDCVVITVNHRVGSFGFCDLSALGPEFSQSGANGMMDLVLALQWTRNNAENFGGDPSRVLVFGQSGGGAKTSILLSMPSAKGLFHRAGIMSGSVLRLGSREDGQAGAAAFLKLLGIGKGDVRKLQHLPFQTLLAAQLTLEANARVIGEVPRAFSPTIDGVVLPGHPFEPLAPEVSADIPLIVSTTLDERTYRKVNFDLDEKGLRAIIAKRVGEDRAEAVHAMYRQESPYDTPYLVQARFDTDEYFRKSALALTQRKAQQGRGRVWSYLWRAPSPAYGGRYGATHSMDVGPSLHDVRGGLNGATLESVRLADELASAWVTFAATGDPNNDRTPTWPSYTVPERATLILDRSSHVEHDPRRAFREFWEREPAPGSGATG